MSFDPKTYSSLDDLRAQRWYLAGSEELMAHCERRARLLKEFNELANTDRKRGDELLTQLLATGSAVPEAIAPLQMDYGINTTFGPGCFLNFNTVILDVAEVTFGSRTLVGPNCQFITVGHPINDVEMRAGGWEQAHPITIGDDCWLGAGVTVLAGVNIGDRCVIGAGTLVTRDMPADSLVLGSPGRVVRMLNQGDDRLEREDLPAGAPVEGLNFGV